MWKKIFTTAGASTHHPWRTLANRHSTSSSSSASAAVNSLLLRSLKENYLEVSKMTPPPKINPPSGFSVLKGALDTDGPVLQKIYGKNEEISITAMRLSNIIPGVVDGDDDNDDEEINQLFLHVNVSKPGEEDTLHFLCGLYPDAMGIHSVCMRPKLQTLQFSSTSQKYGGPTFHDLEEKTKDALYAYIEERGVNESLFPFLQAWLYVKEHRNLSRWFRSVGTFISEQKSASVAK